MTDNTGNNIGNNTRIEEPGTPSPDSAKQDDAKQNNPKKDGSIPPTKPDTASQTRERPSKTIPQTKSEPQPGVTKTVITPTPEPAPEPAPKHTSSQKRATSLFIIIGLMAAALLVMGYLMLTTEKEPIEGSGNIRQMQQITQKIRTQEAGIKEKQDETVAMVNQYKEKTGQPLTGINPYNLTEEARQLLLDKIKNEKDLSTKALLEEVSDKIKEINTLQLEIAKLEALLPKPHVVKEGENHFQIAMDFLLNEKGIDKKAAAKLVERTALIEPLVPGFKVWNFYSGDAYGSSVTQGTAPISPNQLIRKAKKKLVDARDEAVAEKNKLSEELTVLEKRRDEIITQVNQLNKQKVTLIEKVSELDEQNTEMQEALNSLAYLLDTQRNLKKAGILKGGFLKSTKLKNVSPQFFNKTIDLRSADRIDISAADLGLSKIKSITLYPKFYKKGTDYDYQLSGDKLFATLTIKDTTKFKNERVVISIK